jgi:ribosomal protein L21E
MKKAKSTRSTKQNSITRLFQKYQGKNIEVVRKLLEEINPGDYVSIILNSGSDVTGRVLNLFYPKGDPFYRSGKIYDYSGKEVKKSYTPVGIKIDEAQAEEVAHYKDIKSYRRF